MNLCHYYVANQMSFTESQNNSNLLQYWRAGCKRAGELGQGSSAGQCDCPGWLREMPRQIAACHAGAISLIRVIEIRAAAGLTGQLLASPRPVTATPVNRAEITWNEDFGLLICV